MIIMICSLLGFFWDGVLMAFLGLEFFHWSGMGAFSFFLVPLRDLELRQSHSLRNRLVNQYKIFYEYHLSAKMMIVLCKVSNIVFTSEMPARKPCATALQSDFLTPPSRTISKVI